MAVAETADAIVKRFEAQKVEALEGYLAGNPEAEDKAEAEDALLFSYQKLDQAGKMKAILMGRMSAMKTGEALEPQDYFSTLQVLLEVMKEAGMKEEAKALVAKALTDVTGHAEADQMKEFIAQLGSELNQPGVGDTMEIAFTSTTGEAVDLAAMKGKVVLVDFWATWCGPCVEELPNVKEAYEALHGEGFEVVGISLDEDKGELERFVKENGMPWPQDFTGTGWETPLAQKFAIGSIPATFLVGKDGKVVATDLRGESLMAAVKEALAK